MSLGDRDEDWERVDRVFGGSTQEDLEKELDQRRMVEKYVLQGKKMEQRYVRIWV